MRLGARRDARVLAWAATLQVGLGVTSSLVLGAPGCAADPAPAEICAPHPGGSDNPWRDAQGRVVVQRGVNVSGPAKTAVDHLPPLDASDYARIADWGMTSVRLLVFWQALEAEPGVYDTDYLAGVEAHVGLAADAGLEVLIDFHQDVFGEGFGFAGFPRWACDEALYATFTRPSQWFLSYFSTEVTTCFDRFFASAELRASYAAAAAEIAGRLAAHPNVVGFELMNEPTWGSYDTDSFEPEVLRPFYDEVATAVQGAAPRLFIAAEPFVGHNIAMPTRMSPPYGCPTWMYAPHYYPLVTVSGYNGETNLLAQGLTAMVDEARLLGAPLGITEVGIPENLSGSAAFIGDFLELLDNTEASVWIWEYGPGWGFGLVDDQHQPTPVVDRLVRPYVTRIAGAFESQSWDAALGLYSLRYAADGNLAPTEIVVPDALFANGYDVVATSGATSASAPGRLSITAAAGPVEVTVQRQ